MKPHTAVGAVTGAPRLILRLEGLAVLGLAVAAYADSGAGWLLFAVLFLTPDLSMLGYLAGRAVGAAAYNAAHTYLAPAALLGAGFATGSDLASALGLIWAAHIGFDRALGYGLKYGGSFYATHLGIAPFAPQGG